MRHHNIVLDMTQQTVLMCRSRKRCYFPSYTTQSSQYLWWCSLKCFKDENINFFYCPTYHGTMHWGQQIYHVYSTATPLVRIDRSSYWVSINTTPSPKILYAAMIKIRLQYPSQHVGLYHAYFYSHETMSAEEALEQIIDNTHSLSPNNTVMTVQDFYRKPGGEKNQSWEAVLEVLVM